MEESKASLSVTAASFKGAADARVTITGLVVPVKDQDEKATCREMYLAAHPSAFWIDFGDFTFYRMLKADFKQARLVGGFARAGSIDSDKYLTATVDPVSQFSGPVSDHMNSVSGKSNKKKSFSMGLAISDVEIQLNSFEKRLSRTIWMP